MTLLCIQVADILNNYTTDCEYDLILVAQHQEEQQQGAAAAAATVPLKAAKLAAT